MSSTLTLTPVSFSYSGASCSLTTVPHGAGRKIALSVFPSFDDCDAPAAHPPSNPVVAKATPAMAANRPAPRLRVIMRDFSFEMVIADGIAGSGAADRYFGIWMW